MNLMEEQTMIANFEVVLLAHTPDIEKIISTAARTCYSDQNITNIFDHYDPSKAKSFINMLKTSGHESVFEHITFTFGIDGISRAATHQLVRHRMASYSQKSQRYVSESDFDFIVPDSIKENKEAMKQYLTAIRTISVAYDKLMAIGSIPKEDARYVLPNACASNIVVTMNVRELFHFFELRLCQRAQWEIREIAGAMLNICKNVSPVLFDSVGPFCVQHRYCKEGSRSCGAFPSLDKLISTRRKNNE